MCFGQMQSVSGEVMMLEHCGSAGHVWKIINLASFEEVEPEDDDPDAPQSVLNLEEGQRQKRRQRSSLLVGEKRTQMNVALTIL